MSTDLYSRTYRSAKPWINKSGVYVSLQAVHGVMESGHIIDAEFQARTLRPGDTLSVADWEVKTAFGRVMWFLYIFNRGTKVVRRRAEEVLALPT